MKPGEPVGYQVPPTEPVQKPAQNQVLKGGTPPNSKKYFRDQGLRFFIASDETAHILNQSKYNLHSVNYIRQNIIYTLFIAQFVYKQEADFFDFF